MPLDTCFPLICFFVYKNSLKAAFCLRLLGNKKVIKKRALPWMIVLLGKRSNNYKWMSGVEQYWGESFQGAWFVESLKTARDTRPQAEGGLCTEPWKKRSSMTCSGDHSLFRNCHRNLTVHAVERWGGKGDYTLERSWQPVKESAVGDHRRSLKSRKSLPVSTPKAASTWRACTCIAISSETAFGKNFNNAAMRAWSEAAESLLLLQAQVCHSFYMYLFLN